MKTEIKKILYRFLQDGLSSDDASQQILDLIHSTNQQRELLAFKDWFNELPNESDDRLYITNETIDRFDTK